MTKKGRVKANTALFSDLKSEAEAYWLGFLFTDGCLSGDKIVVNLAEKDSGHLYKIAKFFESPRAPRHWIRPRDGRSYSTFTLTSCVIADSLRRLGLHPNKTWTVTPWGGPPDLMRHFWRGCIDGDGSIHESKKKARGVPHTEWRVHFCGNFAMVAGLNDYLKSAIGISASVAKVRSPTPDGNQFFSVRYSEKAAAVIVSHLYVGSTVALDRKMDQVTKLLERRKTRKGAVELACTTVGCDKPYAAKGYCNSCWRRNYRLMGKDKSRSDSGTTWTNLVTAL